MNSSEEFSISEIEKSIRKYREQQDRFRKMSLNDWCFKKIGSSLFEEAMKEFREQQDQAKQKVEVKNKCYHPHKINHCGREMCVSCGLYLKRILVYEDHDDRVLFQETELHKTEEMKNILHKMMKKVNVDPN